MGERRHTEKRERIMGEPPSSAPKEKKSIFSILWNEGEEPKAKQGQQAASAAAVPVAQSTAHAPQPYDHSEDYNANSSTQSYLHDSYYPHLYYQDWHETQYDETDRAQDYYREDAYRDQEQYRQVEYSQAQYYDSYDRPSFAMPLSSATYPSRGYSGSDVFATSALAAAGILAAGEVQQGYAAPAYESTLAVDGSQIIANQETFDYASGLTVNREGIEPASFQDALAPQETLPQGVRTALEGLYTSETTGTPSQIPSMSQVHQLVSENLHTSENVQFAYSDGSQTDIYDQPATLVQDQSDRLTVNRDAQALTNQQEPSAIEAASVYQVAEPSIAQDHSAPFLQPYETASPTFSEPPSCAPYNYPETVATPYPIAETATWETEISTPYAADGSAVENLPTSNYDAQPSEYSIGSTPAIASSFDEDNASRLIVNRDVQDFTSRLTVNQAVPETFMFQDSSASQTATSQGFSDVPTNLHTSESATSLSSDYYTTNDSAADAMQSPWHEQLSDNTQAISENLNGNSQDLFRESNSEFLSSETVNQLQTDNDASFSRTYEAASVEPTAPLAYNTLEQSPVVAENDASRLIVNRTESQPLASQNYGATNESTIGASESAWRVTLTAEANVPASEVPWLNSTSASHVEAFVDPSSNQPYFETNHLTTDQGMSQTQADYQDTMTEWNVLANEPASQVDQSTVATDDNVSRLIVNRDAEDLASRLTVNQPNQEAVAFQDYAISQITATQDINESNVDARSNGLLSDLYAGGAAEPLISSIYPDSQSTTREWLAPTGEQVPLISQAEATPLVQAQGQDNSTMLNHASIPSYENLRTSESISEDSHTVLQDPYAQVKPTIADYGRETEQSQTKADSAGWIPDDPTRLIVNRIDEAPITSDVQLVEQGLFAQSETHPLDNPNASSNTVDAFAPYVHSDDLLEQNQVVAFEDRLTTENTVGSSPTIEAPYQPLVQTSNGVTLTDVSNSALVPRTPSDDVLPVEQVEPMQEPQQAGTLLNTGKEPLIAFSSANAGFVSIQEDLAAQAALPQSALEGFGNLHTSAEPTVLENSPASAVRLNADDGSSLIEETSPLLLSNETNDFDQSRPFDNLATSPDLIFQEQNANQVFSSPQAQENLNAKPELIEAQLHSTQSDSATFAKETIQNNLVSEEPKTNWLLPNQHEQETPVSFEASSDAALVGLVGADAALIDTQDNAQVEPGVQDLIGASANLHTSNALPVEESGHASTGFSFHNSENQQILNQARESAGYKSVFEWVPQPVQENAATELIGGNEVLVSSSFDIAQADDLLINPQTEDVLNPEVLTNTSMVEEPLLYSSILGKTSDLDPLLPSTTVFDTSPAVLNADANAPLAASGKDELATSNALVNLEDKQGALLLSDETAMAKEQIIEGSSPTDVVHFDTLDFSEAKDHFKTAGIATLGVFALTGGAAAVAVAKTAKGVAQTATSVLSSAAREDETLGAMDEMRSAVTEGTAKEWQAHKARKIRDAKTQRLIDFTQDAIRSKEPMRFSDAAAERTASAVSAAGLSEGLDGLVSSSDPDIVFVDPSDITIIDAPGKEHEAILPAALKKKAASAKSEAALALEEAGVVDMGDPVAAKKKASVVSAKESLLPSVKKSEVSVGRKAPGVVKGEVTLSDVARDKEAKAMLVNKQGQLDIGLIKPRKEISGVASASDKKLLPKTVTEGKILDKAKRLKNAGAVDPLHASAILKPVNAAKRAALFAPDLAKNIALPSAQKVLAKDNEQLSSLLTMKDAAGKAVNTTRGVARIPMKAAQVVRGTVSFIRNLTRAVINVVQGIAALGWPAIVFLFLVILFAVIVMISSLVVLNEDQEVSETSALIAQLDEQLEAKIHSYGYDNDEDGRTIAIYYADARGTYYGKDEDGNSLLMDLDMRNETCKLETVDASTVHVFTNPDEIIAYIDAKYVGEWQVGEASWKITVDIDDHTVNLIDWQHVPAWVQSAVNKVDREWFELQAGNKIGKFIQEEFPDRTDDDEYLISKSVAAELSNVIFDQQMQGINDEIIYEAIKAGLGEYRDKITLSDKQLKKLNGLLSDLLTELVGEQDPRALVYDEIVELHSYLNWWSEDYEHIDPSQTAGGGSGVGATGSNSEAGTNNASGYPNASGYDEAELAKWDGYNEVSVYGINEPGSVTGDGTPITNDWSDTNMAIACEGKQMALFAYWTGAYKKLNGNTDPVKITMYNPQTGKTVTAEVRDVGGWRGYTNSKYEGKNPTRQWDLLPAVWKALGGGESLGLMNVYWKVDNSATITGGGSGGISAAAAKIEVDYIWPAETDKGDFTIAINRATYIRHNIQDLMNCEQLVQKTIGGSESYGSYSEYTAVLDFVVSKLREIMYTLLTTKNTAGDTYTDYFMTRRELGNPFGTYDGGKQVEWVVVDPFNPGFQDSFDEDKVSVGIKPLNAGWAVHAVEEGTVEKVEGGTIVISRKTADGEWKVFEYANVGHIKVKVNDEVKRGTHLGYVDDQDKPLRISWYERVMDASMSTLLDEPGMSHRDWAYNPALFMTGFAGYEEPAAPTKVSGGSGARSLEDCTTIVDFAHSRLGCPYVWGATGPDTFDCSGLTQWCYKQAGITIPRNSEAQHNAAVAAGNCHPIDESQMQPGDILWKSGHVGIYIGNNRYIHAPTEGDVVKISTNINYFTHYLRFTK